jgi:hypothetical protein
VCVFFFRKLQHDIENITGIFGGNVGIPRKLNPRFVDISNLWNKKDEHTGTMAVSFNYHFVEGSDKIPTILQNSFKGQFDKTNYFFEDLWSIKLYLSVILFYICLGTLNLPKSNVFQ